MSRLTIDITDVQHQSLKALAMLQGKSTRQYAIERPFLPSSDKDQAWQGTGNAAESRIAEGLAGGVSANGVDVIIKEELDRDSDA